jgi:hypothetical protein
VVGLLGLQVECLLMRPAARSFLGLALLLSACAGGGPRTVIPATPAPNDPRLAETRISPATPEDDLDSLAVWRGPES